MKDWAKGRSVGAALAASVMLLSVAGCGAERPARGEARAQQEGFVDLLETDSRPVSGSGRDLADSVRAAYESATWFGDTSEKDGRGVLMAYFSGTSEIGGGLFAERVDALLCARLEVSLVEGRVQADSTDVPCPQELLDGGDDGRPPQAELFQRFDEDGDAEWVRRPHN